MNHKKAIPAKGINVAALRNCGKMMLWQYTAIRTLLRDLTAENDIRVQAQTVPQLVLIHLYS